MYIIHLRNISTATFPYKIKVYTHHFTLYINNRYLRQSAYSEKKIKRVIVNYQRYRVNYRIRCRFISSMVHLHDAAVNSRLRQPCDTFMIVLNIKRIKAYLYNNDPRRVKSSYRY